MWLSGGPYVALRKPPAKDFKGNFHCRNHSADLDGWNWSKEIGSTHLQDTSPAVATLARVFFIRSKTPAARPPAVQAVTALCQAGVYATLAQPERLGHDDHQHAQ